MGKVAYLFGAGASAQCLPVIKGMKDELGKFASMLEIYRDGSKEVFAEIKSNVSVTGGIENLTKGARLLEHKCDDHSSIDTYAKKVFITTSDEEYIELKAVLTCFFSYLQATRKPDNRYDSFFASILNQHSRDFLEEINILSWNYDHQFEQSYSQFSKRDTISDNQLILSVYESEVTRSNINDKFSIHKINGSDGYLTRGFYQPEYLFNKITEQPDEKLVQKLVWYYVNATRGGLISSRLSFAWEKKSNSGIDFACDRIRNSKALVLIGYSFPFFNREVDRKIMQALFIANKPQIYVQDIDPDPVIDRVRAACPAGPNVEIIAIKGRDQFYLPAEL